jgi:hypothetical protein
MAFTSAFRPALEKIIQGAGKVSVWRRFMVLGRGLEFIIFGLAPLALQTPVGWQMRAEDRTVLPSSVTNTTV